MSKTKLSLDRADIKLVVDDYKEYFYNKNNVTCCVSYYVKMPRILEYIIGCIDGTVKATAYCAEEDTYNKTIGEKIALAKAESSAYAKASAEIAKRLQSVEDMIYRIEPLVEDFTNKSRSCVAHNNEYVETISSKDYVRDFIDAQPSDENKRDIFAKIWRRRNGSTNKKA